MSLLVGHTSASAGQKSFVQTSHGLDKRRHNDTLKQQNLIQGAQMP